MRKPWVGAGWSVALLSPLPGAAIPPPPVPPPPAGALTYSDQALEKTPPSELAAQVLGEVARRMIEYRVDERRFYGSATAGDIGVCAVETVSVGMVKESANRSISSPSYVSGVSFETLYRLIDAPDFPETKAACSKLKPGETYWFAPKVSASSIHTQVTLLSQAIKAASGKSPLGFRVSCARGAPEGCRPRAALASLKAADIVGVEYVECLARSLASCTELRVGLNWVVELGVAYDKEDYYRNTPILKSVGLSRYSRWSMLGMR